MIVGGVADHIHLLLSLRATHAVADLVREIKKASSNWAAGQCSAFAWQTGYAAFSVSASEVPRVTAYIATQEEHHRKLSSAEELRLLLAEHGVEFDERFFE
jgi:REP element-mobilizing transposase RayT